MLNIAVVDDEDEVVAKIKEYVKSYFEEEMKDIEYKLDAFSSGVSFLSSPFNAYDIVFLDIRMPAMDGLDVAREYRLENQNACLVFITNLAEMAIHGYEVSAMDFIVKPVSYTDFCYTLKKAIKWVRFNLQESVSIVSRRRIVKLPVAGILFVESSKHKMIYHTVSGDVEGWASMSETENMLTQYKFARCNSCYLVNLRHVDEIAGNEVCIGDYRLGISRNRKASFMRTFMSYLDGKL